MALPSFTPSSNYSDGQNANAALLNTDKQNKDNWIANLITYLTTGLENAYLAVQSVKSPQLYPQMGYGAFGTNAQTATVNANTTSNVLNVSPSYFTLNFAFANAVIEWDFVIAFLNLSSGSAATIQNFVLQRSTATNFSANLVNIYPGGIHGGCNFTLAAGNPNEGTIHFKIIDAGTKSASTNYYYRLIADGRSGSFTGGGGNITVKADESHYVYKVYNGNYN